MAAADYVLDTTGSVTLLNTVAQGAAVTQRVGKKIVMKGLQCRGNLQNGSTANSNDVAFMIVYDKRPTGALPTVSDILVSASSSAMNNDANTGRFSILKRHDDILIGNLTAAANWTEATVKSCDWWLDLTSKPVVYKAAGTGAIGDIEEGSALPRDRRSGGGRHGGRCDARGLSSPLPGRLRLKNLRIASISILGVRY